MKPNSFCCICTENSAFELVGLLLSLSIYHRKERIYILCDTKTKQIINNITPQPILEIIWLVKLDKYSGMKRHTMEANGMWSEFQMSKANVIKEVLEYENDTLFLDVDIIITDVIDGIDKSKEIGVSPQFIKEKLIEETGYYNGGMLWTKNKNVPVDWIEYTKTSRFYDQASIEDLVKKYSYFEFDENYNLLCWRHHAPIVSEKDVENRITSKENKIYYNEKPIKFVHTHFLHKSFKRFNDVIIDRLKQAKMYKILVIIYRIINGNWNIIIPKQPLQGKWFHKNDSFREMPIMMKINNEDVDIKFGNNTKHCWLEPNILLYDRPTLEWVDEEMLKSSLILLGNGDIKVEGKKLENMGNKKVKPWIFWPRRPILVEKILEEKGILEYNDRKIESIFIGNYENDTQEKYRKTEDNWEDVLTEYHCTKGGKYKFTHEEYLIKLRESKYGLCLRGYGSKCHREVELMAFGTVPIVTPEVTMNSYMETLIEDTHYIRVKNVEEMRDKMEKIKEEKWKEMSEACYGWYDRNVNSKKSWNNMIEHILYDD